MARKREKANSITFTTLCIYLITVNAANFFDIHEVEYAAVNHCTWDDHCTNLTLPAFRLCKAAAITEYRASVINATRIVKC